MPAVPGRILIPLFAVLIIATGPALAAKESRPNGEISGRITKADTGKGASGALVTAVNLTSGEVFKGEPASGDGHFKITHLPYGDYAIGIELDGVLQAGDRPIELAPGSRARFDAALPATPEGLGNTLAAVGVTGGGPQIPGMEKTASGTVELSGLDKPPFLKTPFGLGALAVGIVVFLILI
jgi:hypothetical protein